MEKSEAAENVCIPRHNNFKAHSTPAPVRNFLLLRADILVPTAIAAHYIRRCNVWLGEDRKLLQIILAMLGMPSVHETRYPFGLQVERLKT